MLLQDKVIIVTGAGGGIGEGIAQVCTREGAQVVVADIRGEAVQQVATALGDRALAVTANDEQLHCLVTATVDRFGSIDR